VTRPLEVVLAGTGSRGDLQPLVVLGAELARRGHRVHLVGPPGLARWAALSDIHHHPTFVDYDALPRFPGRLEIMRLQRRMARSLVFDLARVAPAASAIVASLHPGAPSVAQWCGAPLVTLFAAPAFVPSADHAPPGMRSSRHALVNRGLWRLAAGLVDLALREPLRRARAELGLPPPEPLFDSFTGSHIALAWDEALWPAPSDKGRGYGSRPVAFTQLGALLSPPAAPLPPALERFLERGATPVFAGFGSMHGFRDPAALARVVTDAARRMGLRLVLDLGPRAASMPPTDDVMLVRQVCHRRLFARVAAVIHHGGAGTVATAARAGVPQVIVPHALDQAGWSSVVVARGVGAAAPGIRRLSVAGLTEALSHALTPATRAASAALGARLAASDPQAPRAADLVERLAR